jgi:hypothetical protein
MGARMCALTCHSSNGPRTVAVLADIVPIAARAFERFGLRFGDKLFFQ